MSIEYAILAALANKPLTGYDLKKLIQQSPYMPWSGNSNQVYKSLSALNEKGYITLEVFHQESLPSKKVYTNTESGRDALRQWVKTPAEPMELGKPMLLKLAGMSDEDMPFINELLLDYERQVKMQLALYERTITDDSSPSVVCQRLIDENVKMSYQAELHWIQSAQEIIAQRTPTEPENDTQIIKEVTYMPYQTIHSGEYTYLYYAATLPRPEAVDVSQLITDCIELNANEILIEQGALPEAFYSLRTGIAGEFMQKLAQYNIRAALIIEDEHIKGRFRELLIECNRGNMFHSFPEKASAEKWLKEARVV